MDTVNLEELARTQGFANLEEMRALLLLIRLKLPAERAAYERWSTEDGSKAGLVRLIDMLEARAAARAAVDRDDPSAPANAGHRLRADR